VARGRAPTVQSRARLWWQCGGRKTSENSVAIVEYSRRVRVHWLIGITGSFFVALR